MGRLGLLIVAVASGFLVRHYLGALEMPQRVEQALRRGLGEGYRQQIPAPLAARFEQGVRWGPILRIVPLARPEVERLRDIQFDRVRGINLKLDVYRHKSRPSGCPTLLQIHGGGWTIGDKREQALPLMYQLAAHGWVCVSTNYRLSPHATFPEHLVDVKKALAWIRKHGADYGADPGFVVVTGGSAGGHLAALVALTANDPEYQPGFEEVDTTVQAAVPLYGVYDFTDRWGLWPNRGLARILETSVMKGSLAEIPEQYAKASPLDRIHPDAPPFLIVHGSRDTLVPVEEARRFARELRKVSRAPVVYLEVPGAQHAFELLPSLNTQAVVDGIERFAAAIYGRYLEGKEKVSQSRQTGD
ncbi:MAG: alpha/beta hydrolase [Candidatus Dadabacteria bacterium]|nr:MAG: alpha/beta hydrolase [Candidatus Dadabacteria bacterium]